MAGIAFGLFLLPALPGDRQFLFRDAGRMHWPMKSWIAGELARGHLPTWNPYAGLGVPVIATGVDGVLHPFNLLFLTLPFDLAFKGWVLLALLFGGLGAALWARRLGVAPGAPAVAGLAFALAGFSVSSSDNLTYLTALAAAPWLLAAGHAFGTKGGPAPLAATGLASFVCASAGDPMGWGAAVALAIATAFVASTGGWSGARRCLALGLAAAAAAAPAVLPVVLWLPHSARADALSAGEALSWNLPAGRLLELVSPHLSRGPRGDIYNPIYEALAPDDPRMRPWALSIYGGVTVMVLAVVAAVRGRWGRLLVAASGIALWMAMGHHAGFGQLARTLPLLDGLRYWEKLVAWPSLLLAVAAGLGGTAVVSDARLARRTAAAAALAAGALLAVALAAQLLPQGVAGMLGPGARGAGVRAALAANVWSGGLHGAAALAGLSAACWISGRGMGRSRALALLVVVVGGDLYAANQEALGLVPSRIVEGAAPLAAIARSTVQPRLVTPFELPHERRHGLQVFESDWQVGRRLLVDAWNVPELVGNFDAYTGMPPLALARVRDALGRRGLASRAGLWGFSLAATPADPGAVAQLMLPAPPVVAGEDPQVLAWLIRIPHRPRAYVASEVLSAAPEEAIRFAASEPLGSDRTVIDGPVPSRIASGGAARIVADQGERVDLEVEIAGDAPGLLVLSDQHAPGWSAEIDGVPVDIVTANALARGTWVPRGRHVVTFRYRAPGLLAGLMLAAGCAAVIAGWGAARQRSRREVGPRGEGPADGRAA